MGEGKQDKLLLFIAKLLERNFLRWKTMRGETCSLHLFVWDNELVMWISSWFCGNILTLGTALREKQNTETFTTSWYLTMYGDAYL